MPAGSRAQRVVANLGLDLAAQDEPPEPVDVLLVGALGGVSQAESDGSMERQRYAWARWL